MVAKAIAKKGSTEMAVILRDVPTGFNWGWFSREDQRMHLQTLDSKNFGRYKVWLERKGKRVIEPDGPLPAKVLKKLEIEIQRLRRHIEGRWTNFMIRHDWIRLHVALPEVVLTAYPDTPNKITRKVDLSQWFSPETYRKIRPDDVFLNQELPALSVFKDQPEDLRDDFYLPEILWVD